MLPGTCGVSPLCEPVWYAHSGGQVWKGKKKEKVDLWLISIIYSTSFIFSGMYQTWRDSASASFHHKFGDGSVTNYSLPLIMFFHFLKQLTDFFFPVCILTSKAVGGDRVCNRAWEKSLRSWFVWMTSHSLMVLHFSNRNRQAGCANNLQCVRFCIKWPSYNYW